MWLQRKSYPVAISRRKIKEGYLPPSRNFQVCHPCAMAQVCLGSPYTAAYLSWPWALSALYILRNWKGGRQKTFLQSFSVLEHLNCELWLPSSQKYTLLQRKFQKSWKKEKVLEQWPVWLRQEGCELCFNAHCNSTGLRNPDCCEAQHKLSLQLLLPGRSVLFLIQTAIIEMIKWKINIYAAAEKNSFAPVRSNAGLFVFLTNWLSMYCNVSS